ncbi:hypothetical protein [Niallia taxi]|uniref:Uncharacterized protein n=1 Tax=Niallia taxi TaxID=2499688 RepID=A0A3S2UGV2_9BACI|nr:hypothetical protein [Niallia taxi]RVT65294.1 hypothetical protein EM808_07240 [Niallia taxi]
MFISYTDASIKNKKAYLGFVVIFEDSSVIRRRIVVDESNNNIAEYLAICELISFLEYYNLKKGLIVFDSDSVKHQMKKNRKKIFNNILINIEDSIRELQLRTQVIPRKLNVAHKLSYQEKFRPSAIISEINRSYYDKVPNYPEYYMQLSVLSEYRQIYNKRLASFHVAQMSLNKKIWLADLVEDLNDIKIFAIHDRRIKVVKDTVVKIWKVNYVQISNHWRVIRRRKKLKKLIEK